MAPGPGQYNPGKPTGMVLKNHPTSGFGGTAARDVLIARNAIDGPFGDPTYKKSPSP